MPLSISKTILFLEAFPLAYLTYLGLVLSFGAVVPVLAGSFNESFLAAQGLLILLNLAAGWRIYLAFFVGGAQGIRAVGRLTWGLAILGGILSVSAFLLSWLTHESQFDTLFIFGIFFVIPLIHLGAEARFRQ